MTVNPSLARMVVSKMVSVVLPAPPLNVKVAISKGTAAPTAAAVFASRSADQLEVSAKIGQEVGELKACIGCNDVSLGHLITQLMLECSKPFLKPVDLALS